MNDRHTADSITSDALDQLYERLDHARNAAALHRQGLLSTAELYAAVEAGLNPGPTATQATDKPERCCVCGGGAVVYHNYREQPFCWPCADCGCNQNVCVRTGINDPAVSQAAAVLREVLNAFTTARRDDGVVAGHFLEGAIHPDDMNRWRAALPKEQH